MEWKDEYSIGIQEIDDQHEELLMLFARIENSTKGNRGWKAVVYDLVDLKVFARRHFDFEERLMRLYGYKNSGEHEKQHLHFFTKLTEIESLSIPNIVERELITFLFDWLTLHVAVEDKGYADHILSGAPVLRSNVTKLTVVESAG